MEALNLRLVGLLLFASEMIMVTDTPVTSASVACLIDKYICLCFAMLSGCECVCACVHVGVWMKWVTRSCFAHWFS